MKRAQHLSAFCSCLQAIWGYIPIPLRYIVNTWGSIPRNSICRFCKYFPPLQYPKEGGNDPKLPAAVLAHCTVVGLLLRTVWLEVAIPRQHLSTIFITVFSRQFRPLLTTVEFIRVWAQTAVWSVQYMQLFVTSHWCEPDVNWMYF